MRGSGFPTPPATAGRPARWLALAAALAALVAVESLTRAETPADPVRGGYITHEEEGQRC